MMALSKMDQEAMDRVGFKKEEQPNMWGAIQAAAADIPKNGPSRTGSSWGRAAAETYGNNGQTVPLTGRRSSMGSRLSGPPMQLGPYNLEKAGMKVDGFKGFTGEIKEKEDNQVMNCIGQAFAQNSLKIPAHDDQAFEEREKTYRHATLSGRRNQRHFQTSLVMPTTEVTRWAAECGFGVPPAGAPSKQWGTGRPAKEFLKDGKTRTNTAKYSQRGSNYHGHYGIGRAAAENTGDNMAQIEASIRTKRMGRIPGKANAWWSYAANNAPKCILPHVLHGRRSSSSMM